MLPISPNFGAAFCRSIGIVLISCSGLAGCASLGTWGAPPSQQAAPDPDAQIGAQLRKPGPPGQMLGIDDRAREIERNLGVR
jgi:hypothetical protein